MNQIKIGKFITDERKKKEYSQMELANRLGISNKTISKWERGNGFPDVSLLLPLCKELDISVNELLTGERILDVDYKRKAEENMVEIINRNRVSMEERMITWMLTISLGVMALTGGIAAKFFIDPSAQAAILIMTIASLMCIVAIWITTTICLRKKK